MHFAAAVEPWRDPSSVSLWPALPCSLPATGKLSLLWPFSVQAGFQTSGLDRTLLLHILSHIPLTWEAQTMGNFFRIKDTRMLDPAHRVSRWYVYRQRLSAILPLFPEERERVTLDFFVLKASAQVVPGISGPAFQRLP